MSKRVLIIDDSTYIRTQIRHALSAAGYEIVGEAKNGESGIDQAIDLKPDIITLDNVMPDMSGIDVIRALKGQDLSAKIVMISAVGQRSAINECLENGAVAYIVKPFTQEQLTQAIIRAME